MYYIYSHVFAFKMADKVQHTSLFEREHWIFSDIDMPHVYNFKTSQLCNILEDEPFAKHERVLHTPQQPGPLPPLLSPHHYSPLARRPLRPWTPTTPSPSSDSHSPSVLPVVNLNARIQNTFSNAQLSLLTGCPFQK